MFQCLFQLLDRFPETSSPNTSIQLVYRASPPANIRSGFGIRAGYPDAMVSSVLRQWDIDSRRDIKHTAPYRNQTHVLQFQIIIPEIGSPYWSRFLIYHSRNTLKYSQHLEWKIRTSLKHRTPWLNLTTYASACTFRSSSSSHRTGITKVPFFRSEISSI